MISWEIWSRALAGVAEVFEDPKKRFDGFVSADEERKLLDFVRLGDEVRRAEREGRSEWSQEASFVKARGEAATERLVFAYLPLVRHIASHYKGRGLPSEDLVQEGIIGLIKSIRRFDYRDVRLSSCAQPWIRSSISRAIDRSRNIVRLPERTTIVIRKILRTIEFLNDSGEHRIRPEAMCSQDFQAVADELNRDPGNRIQPGQVNALLQLSQGRGAVSLSQPIGENGRVLEDTLGDQLPIDEPDELDPRILEAMELLAPMERGVILLRCGFGIDEPLTLEEVGRRFNCSAEWVRRVEKAALNKLKAAVRPSRASGPTGPETPENISTTA